MWLSWKGANPLLLSSTWGQSSCLSHFQLINISPAPEPIINPPDNVAPPLHQTTVQRSSKSLHAWSQNFTPSCQHNQRWTWEPSRTAARRFLAIISAPKDRKEPNHLKHLQWRERRRWRHYPAPSRSGPHTCPCPCCQISRQAVKHTGRMCGGTLSAERPEWSCLQGGETTAASESAASADRLLPAQWRSTSSFISSFHSSLSPIF